MAAKKKSNSSQENNKPKKTGGRKNAPKPKKELENTDDDFGLDDIELEPVSENPEEEIPTPEPIIDPIETIDEVTEEKEEVAAPEPFIFSTGDDTASIQESSTEEEPKKEEEKKSNSGVILLVILLIIVIAAALYFFVFKNDKPEPEPVKVEKPIEQPKPEPEPQLEPEPVKPKAELFTISSPQGRWYVVVGSFYDEDLAEDKARAIVAAGESAYLLNPSGDNKFHRVGVAQSASMAEAEQKRTNLLGTYGENIWVLKY